MSVTIYPNENKRGYQKVVNSTSAGTAILADTSMIVQQDLNDNEGWLFGPNVLGEKFNLYFGMGTGEVLTLNNLKCLWAQVSIGSNSSQQSLPFFHVYTKMEHDGQDAGLFYRTKITYTFDRDNTFISLGEQVIIHTDHKPDLNGETRRFLKLEDKAVTGPNNSNEELLYLALGSDSSAPDDDVLILVSHLGYESHPNLPYQDGNKTILRNIKLKYG